MERFVLGMFSQRDSVEFVSADADVSYNNNNNLLNKVSRDHILLVDLERWY